MTGDDLVDEHFAALLGDDPETLYERAPCGYLSTAPDGTIVRVNQTLLARTGYRRDELIGRRTFSDLLTGGGRIYYETHYAPMLEMQGRVREIALDIVAADGRRLPALINSVLEHDADGHPVVVRTAVFDATERREYERELLRSKQRAEESEAHAKVLARTLQQTLIPPAAPDVPGLDVAAVYRPAGRGDEIGGDFYDIFEVAEDDWIVVVGDVCGKGIDAAVVTAAARHSIRAAAVRQHSPREMLDTLNQVLLQHGSDRFCTVALLRLRRAGGVWTATVGLGGHPAPLLCRGDAEPTPFGESGTIVGILDATAFHDVDVVLEHGDTLVLYTDGVTEGRHDTEFFGAARLDAALTHRPSAAAVTDGVLAEVLAFQSGDARDDIVVVAVRVP